MKKIYLSLLFLAAVTFSAVCLADDLPNISEIIEKLGSQDVGRREQGHNEWQRLCMKAGGNAELRGVVNKAAAEALEAGVPVEARVELLQQLQWIGTDAEVEIIAKMVTDTEYTVRDEAIRALSKLGDKGINTLKAMLGSVNAQDKKIIQDTLAQLNPNLSVSKESVKTMSLVTADDETVANWMKNYNSLSMEEKISTLAALTARGDRKYTSFAVAAAKMQPAGDDEMGKLLKDAGRMALEKLATKNEVSLLVDLAVNFDYGRTMDVASRVQSEGFDEALLNLLGTTTDRREFGAISEMLARRNSGAAWDSILEKAKAHDCPDRLALFTNAVAVGGNDKIGDLLDVLAMFPLGADREKAEKLVVGRCDGNSHAIRERMDRLGKRTDWFALLGRVGDDGAWDVLKEAVKNSDTRDAAVRGLCNFPHAKYAPALMEIVENEQFSGENRLAALRAFIRVVSLPTQHDENEKKLAALKVAMEKSWRDEERRLILSRLSAIRTVDSAKFAYEFVKNDSLRTDAYRALADLAHHNNIRRPNKEYFIPILDEIIQKCQDQSVVERCRGYRNLMD